MILDDIDDVDDILAIWECFDDRMSEEFFKGLTKEDLSEMTDAEWLAAFELPAGEFKRRFLDRMTFEEIYDLMQLVDEGDEDAMAKTLQTF